MPVPRKVYHHRVHIGGSFERWCQERDKLNLSNEKFCQVLLDNFLILPVKSVKLEVFTQTSQEKISKSTQTAPNSTLSVSNDASTSTEETFMKNLVTKTYLKYSKANPKPSPSSQTKYGLAIESPMGSTSSPSKRKALFSSPKGKRCRVNLDQLWQSPIHQSTIVEEDKAPRLILRRDPSKQSDVFQHLLNPEGSGEDEDRENEAEPLNFAYALNEDEESHII